MRAKLDEPRWKWTEAVRLLLEQPSFAGDARLDVVDDVARERRFDVEQPSRLCESFARESRGRHRRVVMSVGRVAVWSLVVLFRVGCY